VTSGIETSSQATVRFEAVWIHFGGAVEGAGATAARELERARLVRDGGCEGGEIGELGFGEEVELRLEGDFVGEAPRTGGGNSLGWWRVETILVFLLVGG
jgi:hypothetical protein